MKGSRGPERIGKYSKRPEKFKLIRKKTEKRLKTAPNKMKHNKTVLKQDKTGQTK